MKVLIPVIDDKQSKNDIADGFISTDYACIYDTQSDSFEYLTASEITEKLGNLSLSLKRKGIFSVISNHMPLMALGLFVESGLSVYKSQGNNVQENIKLFMEDQLQPYTAKMSYEMSSCSSSCSSCSSSCN